MQNASTISPKLRQLGPKHTDIGCEYHYRCSVFTNKVNLNCKKKWAIHVELSVVKP